MGQRGLAQPLLRLRPRRQPERPLPRLVIHLVGVDVLTTPAAAVNRPRTSLNLYLLGVTLVSYEEGTYGSFLGAFLYHVMVAHDGCLFSAFSKAKPATLGK